MNRALIKALLRILIIALALPGIAASAVKIAEGGTPTLLYISAGVFLTLLIAHWALSRRSHRKDEPT